MLENGKIIFLNILKKQQGEIKVDAKSVPGFSEYADVDNLFREKLKKALFEYEKHYIEEEIDYNIKHELLNDFYISYGDIRRIRHQRALNKLFLKTSFYQKHKNDENSAYNIDVKLSEIFPEVIEAHIEDVSFPTSKFDNSFHIYNGPSTIYMRREYFFKLLKLDEYFKMGDYILTASFLPPLYQETGLNVTINFNHDELKAKRLIKKGYSINGYPF